MTNWSHAASLFRQQITSANGTRLDQLPSRSSTKPRRATQPSEIRDFEQLRQPIGDQGLDLGGGDAPAALRFLGPAAVVVLGAGPSHLVIAVALAFLAGMGGRQPVPLVVVQDPRQQAGVFRPEPDMAGMGVGGQPGTNLRPGFRVDDCGMQALVTMPLCPIAPT